MAEEGAVIACHTKDAWTQQLQHANESKKLSVAQDWAIEAMPTFIFLKEGKIVDKIVGAQRDDLVKKVEKHLAK